MDKEITNAELKKLLSEKLARLRKTSGQTIEVTAESLNMAVSEYFRFLKGKRLPQLRTLMRLSKKYGVTLDWWFSKRPELPGKQADLRQKALELELLGSYRKLDYRFQDILRETARVFVKKRSLKPNLLSREYA